MSNEVSVGSVAPPITYKMAAIAMYNMKPPWKDFTYRGPICDVMPGLVGEDFRLLPHPRTEMSTAKGSKVRLTFKLENDELWIGTEERMEKVPIRNVFSRSFTGDEHYHILAIQLGPTEASRLFVYWVPAQYVEAIKDALTMNSPPATPEAPSSQRQASPPLPQSANPPLPIEEPPSSPKDKTPIASPSGTGSQRRTKKMYKREHSSERISSSRSSGGGGSRKQRGSGTRCGSGSNTPNAAGHKELLNLGCAFVSAGERKSIDESLNDVVGKGMSGSGGGNRNELLEMKRDQWILMQNNKTGISSLRDDVNKGLKKMGLMGPVGDSDMDGKEDSSMDGHYLVGNSAQNVNAMKKKYIKKELRVKLNDVNKLLRFRNSIKLADCVESEVQAYWSGWKKPRPPPGPASVARIREIETECERLRNENAELIARRSELEGKEGEVVKAIGVERDRLRAELEGKIAAERELQKSVEERGRKIAELEGKYADAMVKNEVLVGQMEEVKESSAYQLGAEVARIREVEAECERPKNENSEIMKNNSELEELRALRVERDRLKRELELATERIRAVDMEKESCGGKVKELEEKGKQLSIPQEEGGKKRHAIPPPGFESLFAQNFPTDCKSPFAALVIAVHWSTVHTTNLRLTDDSTKTPTESLPAGWPSKIAIYEDVTSRFILLEYKNPETGRAVTVKVQELSVNGIVAVMSQEQNPEKNGKAHATTLETEVYVNCSAVQDGERNVYTLYKVDKLRELREIVKNRLLEEEVDAMAGVRMFGTNKY